MAFYNVRKIISQTDGGKHYIWSEETELSHAESQDDPWVPGKPFCERPDRNRTHSVDSVGKGSHGISSRHAGTLTTSVMNATPA